MRWTACVRGAELEICLLQLRTRRDETLERRLRRRASGRCRIFRNFARQKPHPCTLLQWRATTLSREALQAAGSVRSVFVIALRAVWAQSTLRLTSFDT